MSGLRRIHNISDFREAARRRLPRGLFDYIDRGSEDDLGLRHNRDAFEQIRFRPRVLAGVAQRRQAIELFGRRHALPFGIAPTGPASYLWHRGEIALARAASRLEAPFILSCAAGVPMREVAAEGGDGAKWFQLYISGDRARSMQAIGEARAAGFDALVFTVDSIISPNREFAAKAGYTVPPRLSPRVAAQAVTSPRWLVGTIGRYLIQGALPATPNYPLEIMPGDGAGGTALKDASIGWDTLREVREAWPGKLIVKGVLDPRDAVACADAGADAVIVSNHGGLVLDSAMATIEALPAIADAVGDRIDVFLDSGVRRGSDIVKAMGLGAKAVFVGRATLYALAAFGEAGVVRALELLRDEVDRTLASIGCTDINSVSRDHLILPSGIPGSGPQAERNPS